MAIKMTTSALINALIQISKIHPNKEISMIEFEDGSGKCFNYQLVGVSGTTFIRIN